MTRLRHRSQDHCFMEVNQTDISTYFQGSVHALVGLWCINTFSRAKKKTILLFMEKLPICISHRRTHIQNMN